MKADYGTVTERDMDKLVLPDTTRILEQANRFLMFVRNRDKSTGFISFRDSTGFLGREEDYKSTVAEVARRELRAKEWSEKWIGTGRIAECARKAIDKANNLVNYNQKTDFKDRLDPNHPKYRSEAESVLYDLYRNRNVSEQDIFKRVIKTFGAKYDTTAFLFFLKDDSRFLPISPDNFDAAFDFLGIQYAMSHRCSWTNYLGYIEIIRSIREIIEQVLPVQDPLRLIDAHSFVWIINQKRFREWTPTTEEEAIIEKQTEDYIQKKISGSGGKSSRSTTVYLRSTEVVKETKRRAGGICQYCNKPAPFSDKHGDPYLEVHHIKWLSRGGEDSTDNTVALCPNCHTRMHILDDPKDREYLENTIRPR